MPMLIQNSIHIMHSILSFTNSEVLNDVASIAGADVTSYSATRCQVLAHPQCKALSTGWIGMF